MVKNTTRLDRVKEETAVRAVLEWKPTCKRHPIETAGCNKRKYENKDEGWSGEKLWCRLKLLKRTKRQQKRRIVLCTHGSTKLLFTIIYWCSSWIQDDNIIFLEITKSNYFKSTPPTIYTYARLRSSQRGNAIIKYHN